MYGLPRIDTLSCVEGKLTIDIQSNGLLSLEAAHVDCTDVRSLIRYLQIPQGQGCVTICNQQGVVHAGAISLHYCTQNKLE